MAAAMHSAAMGQLGPTWQARRHSPSDADIAFSIEKGESVEILALDEESSRRAAQILQERRLQRHPMRRAMSNVQCNEADGDDDSARKRVPVESPMMRITRQWMPVFTWLPSVSGSTLKSDVISGLTVGLMAVPQSMSFANVAGLRYIYGLYSACVPSLVYVFFGQSRQLALGPVALVSLLIEAGLREQLSEEQCPEWYAGDRSIAMESCADEYAKLAILTSFAVGLMQILASIMKLGFLVSFLGHPVTSGFTSGASILIALGQLKYMLGFDVPKSQYVYETIWKTGEDIGETELVTLFLSIMFLAFLIVNKRLSSKHKKLALMGPFGPLLICIVGTLLVALCTPLRDHVKYIKEIPSGMIPSSFDCIDFASLPKVLPTAMTASLIGYMASIAIGKNLAAKHGYEIEAGQELFALGVANLVGSAFSCYPVTGSFSRSAVNNSMGARTQLSGLITALVMLCTVMFLTPLFYYLPKSALAAIVINSVIPLVAFGEAKRLLRVKKNDFILWIVAFLGTLLLGVFLGIAVAMGLSLVIVIYESVRPQITILWRIPGTTIYRNVKQESSGAFIPNVFICRIGSSMYFANASFVKDMLLRYVSDLQVANPVEYIVLEMTPVVSIDSTAVHIIQDIVNDFRSREIQVAFAMVGNRVEKTMRRAQLSSFIGQQWFFPTVHQAVHYCIRHQHAKRKKLEKKVMDGEDPDGLSKGPSFTRLDVKEDYVAQVGTEIGVCNDFHHTWTAVFINLAHDVLGIMGDIANVFKRNNISVVRAQIEPVDISGAKHIYFVKNIEKNCKLSDCEIQTVQEDLGMIIKSSRAKESDALLLDTPQEELPSESDRIARLEQVISERSRDKAWNQDEILKKQSLPFDTPPDCLVLPAFPDSLPTETSADGRGECMMNI